MLFRWTLAVLFSANVLALPVSGQPDSRSFEQRLFERTFEEPLAPVGAEPTLAETRALGTALRMYGQRKTPDDFSALEAFLQQHPKSPWNAALLTDLGLEFYNTAHYSRALDAWAKAWELAKGAQTPREKAIADRAAGELAYMYARIGRMPELAALLKSLEGRPFTGPATEKIAGAREGLWNMQNRPEISFRCGPLALHRIKASLGSSQSTDMAIFNSTSTQKGTSLPQVAELSRKVGLNYHMAYRETGAPFIVPSVVHWKVGHYAAITRRAASRFLLQDPTFINDTWATTNALEREASGYFLVPSGPLPKGWRAVAAKEGETVWGKGNVTSSDPKETTPDSASTSPCNSNANGMAVPRVHLMLVNLNINDTPVGYAPPVGPEVRFTVRYNHREAFQPGTFTYANLGSKWTCDWISYLTDNPQSPAADVNYYVRGGGTRTFSGFDTNTQRFASQLYDQTRLTRTAPDSYEMLWGNGARMIFSRSDGASGTSRKVFLTQIIDPAGNAVTLNYDANLRLTNIVDAIGQATTLGYTNATDSYKITSVTDPFGRSAVFEYDSLGRLTNITDVIGIKSRFSYESSTDFINALVTPYGTTSFTRGSSGTTRWLETLYPDGSRERVEFNQGSNLGIPFSVSPELVPQGMSTFNQWLYARNTFYWSRTACATAYGDYTKAKIYHWLHTVDLSTATGVLESIKEPLEERVWFDYPGQSAPMVIGSSDRPRHIGRVLDDTSTQLYTHAYDEFGHITNSIDPVGRTFSYLYATNGIDLLEVRMTRAGRNELLYKATYNAQHQPLTTTDAAGQTTTNTYNARGQLLTRTNPKGETTAYSYDANAYLVAVDGPLPGTNDTLRATYDAIGRTRTKTDTAGYTVTFDYDALDRVTRVTYPDATYDEVAYDKLDQSMVRDRAGRQTLLEHNAMRDLVKRTDSGGQVTEYQWCRCGNIKSLTDPLGRTTQWQTDVQGRLAAKEYGDGSRVAYEYEAKSGRLRQITDEKSQAQHFRWNSDDSLRGINFINSVVPTAPIQFTYDPDYPRVTSRTDGGGTTAYQYVPITATPALGAGQIASIDGPLPNDTITYDYDATGVRVAKSIGGVEQRIAHDAAGRTLSETNALGAFAYGYDGATSRRVSETYPSGITATRVFGDAQHDFALAQLTHQAGASLVSEFIYHRDTGAQRISSWSQQFRVQAPQVFTFGYDETDQLLSAVVTNGGVRLGAFAYEYDQAGNRLREQTLTDTNVARYNALNQLSVISGGAATTRTNEWDAYGRLVAVNVGNQRVELGYDGARQLIRIRVIVNGVETSHRRFVWSDGQISEERDGAGVVTKRFFAQGVKIESGTNAGIYFYTRDHLGSVRELIDANGAVRARYSYDPFGRRTLVEGDVESDFGFAGMFWLRETQLAHTLYRVYDPELGRWLSRDPLRNAEIQEGANLYAYVGNNPINATDPFGLCCEKELQELTAARNPVISLSATDSSMCQAAKLEVVGACSYSIPSAFQAQNCAAARVRYNLFCEKPLEQQWLLCLSKPCEPTPCRNAAGAPGLPAAAPAPAPAPAPGPMPNGTTLEDSQAGNYSTGRPAERNAATGPPRNSGL